MSNQSFRPVNSNLGSKPKIGPVPAELIFPWTCIGIGTLIFCQLMALNWVWTTTLILSGISVWWILTGKAPWRFLAKFQPVPRWAKGYVYSTRLDLHHSPPTHLSDKIHETNTQDRQGQGEQNRVLPYRRRHSPF
ncbi:MAG: hypothetical protein AAF329_03640 [Cyanobacteria bacterium P01_A01_bin.17]